MNNNTPPAALPMHSKAFIPLAGTAFAFVTLIVMGLIGAASVAMTMVM
jgi:hypothetical protein